MVKKEQKTIKKKEKLFKYDKKFKENKIKIFELAENLPTGDKILFIEAFDIFETHVAIGRGLKKAMEQDGAIIEKEYVKGRPTIVAHPGIAQYNANSKAINSTISTLLKIFEKIGDNQQNTDLKAILKRSSE